MLLQAEQLHTNLTENANFGQHPDLKATQSSLARHVEKIRMALIENANVGHCPALKALKDFFGYARAAVDACPCRLGDPPRVEAVFILPIGPTSVEAALKIVNAQRRTSKKRARDAINHDYHYYTPRLVVRRTLALTQ